MPWQPWHMVVLRSPAAGSPASAARSGALATTSTPAITTGTVLEIFISGAFFSLTAERCGAHPACAELYIKITAVQRPAATVSVRDEHAGRSQYEQADQGERDDEIRPVPCPRVERDERRETRDRDAREYRNTTRCRNVAPARHGDPVPAGRHPAFAHGVPNRKRPPP